MSELKEVWLAFWGDGIEEMSPYWFLTQREAMDEVFKHAQGGRVLRYLVDPTMKVF